MNRRQKIIVSVTGIFLVLLLLVGLTYAYFLTQITGNQNNKSISVSTANLALEYGDDDASIIGENETIIPGTTFEPKIFTVTNNGNATIKDYAVILENFAVTYANTVNDDIAGTVTSLTYPEDVKITIACTSSVSNKECNGLEGTLPTTNDILLTNSIDVGEVQTYELTLEYLETGTDQSADMNKTIEGKINIIDTSNTVDIEGFVSNIGNEKYYVQTNSTKRLSEVNKEGKYKIVGLEMGSHTLKLCKKSDTTCSSPIISRSITIIGGEEASGNNTTGTLKITKGYRTANIEIDASSKTIIISEKIKFTNPYKRNTFSYTLLNNALNATNNSTVFSEPISNIGNHNLETERVLAQTKDDEGISFYYRGNVVDNYVNFAGMCWRIVRIEGDGAVKLILEDVNETCSNTMDGNWKAGSTGYGVKDYGSSNLFPDYHNSMKQDLKTWFESNAQLQSKQNLLKEDTWCISNFKYDNKGNLILENATSATFMVSNPNGTLECFASGEVEGETDIYKLGGLTYDEVRFAGIGNGDFAANYLINDWYYDNSDLWNSFTLITPIWFDNTASWGGTPGQAYFYILTKNYNGDNFEIFSYVYPDESAYGAALRPVITINKNQIATTKDIAIYGQPGTITNPYIVE